MKEKSDGRSRQHPLETFEMSKEIWSENITRSNVVEEREDVNFSRTSCFRKQNGLKWLRIQFTDWLL
jgi:hypothetical protein